MSGVGAAQWGGAGFSLAGVVLIVVTLVRAYRAGMLFRRRARGLGGLSPSARRAALRQVRGRDPVVTADLPVTRRLAAALVDQRWLRGLAGGLVLIQAGQLTQARGPVWVALSALVLAVLAGAMVLIHRDGRRGVEFLARTG